MNYRFQPLTVLLALLIFGSFFTHCKPNQAQNGLKDPKKNEVDGKSLDAGVDEKVDVPANIAGSYLTCAVRKEAKETDLDAQYGCLLSDGASKKKLDLSASGRLSWGSNLLSGVKITELDQANIYHAYYNVSGATLAEVQENAKKLEAIVSYRLDSGVSVPVKQDRVVNVLKPAVELDDFEAPIVREQTIQADRPGSL